MVDQRLENVADVYVLTPTQEGMLYHTIAEPGSGVFVNQVITPIEGAFDNSAFVETWARLVSRHSALRTAFIWDGLDEPLQVVRDEAEITWEHRDWSELSSSERDDRLAQLLEADRRFGFALEEAPLMRMYLIKTSETTWQWVWSFHHLIIDGWSASVLFEEMSQIYSAVRDGQSNDLVETFQFREYVAWRARLDAGSAEAFWRNQLAGFDEPIRLEVPGLPPDPEARGHRSLERQIGLELTERLRHRARTSGVTLGSLLLSAWALLLARWSDASDVVFGVTNAGRPADLAGIERAVGLFINTLPLRVSVRDDMMVSEYLSHVQSQQAASLQHGHASLPTVQSVSDLQSGDSLFDSIVVFENYPATDSDQHSGLSMGRRRHVEQSNYSLALLVVPGERIELTYVYDTETLGHYAVESLSRQFLQILEQLANDSVPSISEIELLDSSEISRLEEWGRGEALNPGSQSILDMIEGNATRQPDSVAMIFDGQRCTYSELDSRANRVANHLLSQGIEPGALVGLMCPRSPEMVIGILGILKTGCAYVPLDPEYPAEHLNRIADDTLSFILAVDSESAEEQFGAVQVVGFPSEGQSSKPPELEVSGSGIAYVIHTSGSTGDPNGVMVTHDNLLHSTLARDLHYRDPVDTFLLLSSFAFDSSVAGIFWTLANGGTLVLPRPSEEKDAEAVLSLIDRHAVTHTLALPTLYQAIIEGADVAELGSLRVVIVAGEPCATSVVELHHRLLPECALHNEYGPTEATVWCLVHPLSEVEEPVPIGRPTAGTAVRVLDRGGRRVPAGFEGELVVGGPGVARGYLNQPELTAQRFESARDGSEKWYRTGDLVAYRHDGVLLYRGRADSQVKIRGHRVELQAVESALRGLPGVEEAVVTALSNNGSPNKRLIGYVATRQSHEPDSSTRITEALSGRLPGFMIPDQIVTLSEIPRLANGKVDKRSLPTPAEVSSAGARVPPRTDAERALALIWREVLAIDDVSVHDDYFALGGDSITSIRMVSMARQAGLRIEPGQVAQHPTIAALAANVSEGVPSPTSDTQPVLGHVPLSPIQRWFLSQDMSRPWHWNQTRVLELDAAMDFGTVADAVRQCSLTHDMLRAGILEDDGEWKQTVGREPSPVDTRDLAGSTIDEVVADAQAGLRFDGTPLFQATFVSREEAPPLLALVAHHLIMDVVSWSAVLEDLDTALSGSEKLPHRTASFRSWVSALQTGDWAADADYWAAQHGEVARFRSLSKGIERDVRVETVRLDEPSTHQLLTTANEAYGTRPLELMVAALADTLGEWSDAREVPISIEGHGRSPSIELDVSRTVGWFTSLYPLWVSLGKSRSIGDQLKSVKESIRSVPNDGLAYGVLRYMDESNESTLAPEPPVLFNYLGRALEVSYRSFRVVSDAAASSRSPLNTRPHELEVVAEIDRGSLVSHWRFTPMDGTSEMIADLAAGFVSRLLDILEHCSMEDTGGATPSDFPEAGFDQEELDEFLAGLQ